MVSVLREARGWTQGQLAHAAGVSQGYISKIESRLMDLTGERIAAVAAALDAPVALLAAPSPSTGLEVSCMFHRRRSSKVTVADGRRVEAIGHLTRLTVSGLQEGIEGVQIVLRRIDIDEFGPATAIAQLARAEWRVPSGPIPNMMALLDRLGVAVIIRSVGTAGQDAFSTWPIGDMPVVVVNTGLPTDRLRFSLAHELAHVVMHVLPNDDQEQQANEFASELLMPSDEIAEDLAGLTTRQFTRLTELKAKWRVSVGALIQKARTLDIISERQFKEFRIRMSQMGWHVSEPIQLPGEEPHLVSDLIERRRRQLGEDDQDLARAALMTPAAFRRHYLTGTADRATTAERTDVNA
jgi:Zn-dependent peptidase ImmA (M78 family)/transcriptional regulator with XRE-family HTH domain